MNQPRRLRRKRPPRVAPTAIPALAPVEREGAGSGGKVGEEEG